MDKLVFKNLVIDHAEVYIIVNFFSGNISSKIIFGKNLSHFYLSIYCCLLRQTKFFLNSIVTHKKRMRSSFFCNIRNGIEE